MKKTKYMYVYLPSRLKGKSVEANVLGAWSSLSPLELRKSGAIPRPTKKYIQVLNHIKLFIIINICNNHNKSYMI